MGTILARYTLIFVSWWRWLERAGGIQGRKYFGTITIRQLFSQNKYLKCNLKCKEVGGVSGPKNRFSHLNIFRYLDYGEANAFYRIEKAFSGANR